MDNLQTGCNYLLMSSPDTRIPRRSNSASLSASTPLTSISKAFWHKSEVVCAGACRSNAVRQRPYKVSNDFVLRRESESLLTALINPEAMS